MVSEMRQQEEVSQRGKAGHRRAGKIKTPAGKIRTLSEPSSSTDGQQVALWLQRERNTQTSGKLG